MIPRAFALGIGAVVCILLGAWLRGCWAPEPAIVYRDVVVDSAELVRGEPDAQAGLLERLTRPVARPEQRATAPGAAAGDVARFCLAAGYVPPSTDRSAPGEHAPGPAGGVLPGVSLPSPHPELAGAPPAPTAPAPAAAPAEPPSGLPPALCVQPLALGVRSATVGRRASEFWLPLSSGDLVRETYRIRPPYTFRVDGDSLVVRGTRGWWIRELAPLALCAAGAWGSLELDSPVPAAVGCGLGVMLELR